MIAAGELKHYLEIQSPTNTQSSVGGITTTWAKVMNAWAKVDPVTARERFLAAQVHGEIDHRITFRYASELAAINGTWRAIFGSRAFYFSGPPRNVGERNEYYEVLAIEGLIDQ